MATPRILSALNEQNREMGNSVPNELHGRLGPLERKNIRSILAATSLLAGDLR